MILALAPRYRGTSYEQWDLAAVDVALGRISAAELHALGAVILHDHYLTQSAELRAVKSNLYHTEDDLRKAQDDAAKEQRRRWQAEEKLEEAQERIRELERELKALKGLEK